MRVTGIETERNYTRPGYGCTRLLRDITATIADDNGNHPERYSATVEIRDSFGLDVSSVEFREDSTEHTITQDTARYVIQDYLDE